MKPVEIKKGIYWVGAVDWNTIDFHGYSLARYGTTYNAYLVIDKKITLFDTVKEPFADELLDCIAQIVDPCKIDYIVVNHLEPDHAGALPKIFGTCQPQKVFCSPMGEKSLKAHFHTKDWPLEVKKHGETLSLGKRNVQFLETRMLHWPDSMFSYIPEEKMLISSDAFGQNIASSERFVDELDKNFVKRRLTEYYANIVTPFSPVVEKTLGMVTEQELDIEYICPDHGLIYRHKDDVNFALCNYAEFASQPYRPRAVLVYSTMWHSTEKMGKAIADGLMEEGISVRIMDMASYHHSDVMTEVFLAGAVVFGSSTHNNNILPQMADLLTYIKGLKPQNKVAGTFGSFGWSGECVKALNSWVETMGFELVEGSPRIKHVPDSQALVQCVEYGRNIGKVLKTKLG